MKNKHNQPNSSKKKLKTVGHSFKDIKTINSNTTLQPENSSKDKMKYPIDFDKTKLPADTKELGKKYITEVGIDNFSLRLNKAAKFDKNEKGEWEFKLYRKGNSKKKIESFEIEADFSSVPLGQINKRYETAIKLLTDSSCQIDCIEFELNWRMVIGLGNESVYETSMTLHHVYGIPYIPGSAIKGVTRNWWINKNFKLNEQEKNGLDNIEFGRLQEKRALQNAVFCKIFGSPKESILGEHIGSVIFFDAYPIDLKPSNIKVDVINPHYNNYYSKSSWPTDDQDPIPTFFLTLENVRFKIFIGTKFNNYEEGLFNSAKDYLIEALKEHGIGAKTALGYGVMNGKLRDDSTIGFSLEGLQS